MTRRKQGLFDSIASMPWSVGIVLGVIGYFAIRYGVGWYLSSRSGVALAAVGHAANGGAFGPIAWACLGICWVAALCSFIASRQRSRLLETQTGIDSLRAMNWKQFELLVGEAFRRQGYRIEETGLGGPDGGIDLRLNKAEKVTLVQCTRMRCPRR